MNRLTLKYGGGRYEAVNPIDVYDNWYSKANYNELVKRLGEYEDLEEQGKLLKLPCAVGDTVWCVHMYSGGGRVPNWGKIYEAKFSVGMHEDFGKTVFLSKSAAEAALKEMSG
ncbi:hypothetical protein E5329_23820 [Petralouisia muris]|uniref:Uncharacterized protein n=1 Tax=Petralouisia muris TaxID=3032872 RepID=A0AC61RQ26_9FIRM|nr:hypothetical protein [Petralouisia muris]TGY90869.1 hypothetical protein E5329_23820 [Petralouisia muris]